MTFVNWKFITGVKVGFEFIDKQDVEEDEEGTYFLLDFFIVSILWER